MAAQFQPRADSSWVPFPGSQTLFLTCPVYETLLEGTRGPGKTDTLLMDFAQHVGKGFGSAWRGILFRQSHPQLADVIAKSKRWFKAFFGDGANFNEAKSTWIFPGGEELLLRHMRTPDDYWNYHGHEYPWIAWEELTNWANDQCYTVMMSCSRSSRPGMPRKYRATTNPYGVGHNWIKRRFKLPHMRGKVIRTEGHPDRIAIHANVRENLILLKNDPEYISKIRAAARNPSELAAWLDGSWDITSGGMFDDIFDTKVHVVKPFRVPRTWRIDRSFDWGQSAPFSVGWWAESDGSDVALPTGRVLHTIKGDLFRVMEWYGSTGKPNEGLRLSATSVAEGIKAREMANGFAGLVKPGPADTAIFDKDDNGRSIAKDMAAVGVKWEEADKGPGSRKQGWQTIRQMLEDSKGPERRRPGIFVFDTCASWLELVPSLPRDDEDIDDVDTDAEDHNGDETRYRCRWKRKELGRGRMGA